MITFRSAVRSCVPLVLYVGICAAPNLAHAQGAQDYIVQFAEGATPAMRGAAVANAGAEVRFVYGQVRAAAVRVPNEQALAALRNNPSVVSIIPNRAISAHPSAAGKASATGGNGGAPAQVIPAGVARVGIPSSGSNGLGVGVAILDTGVDLAHPDLSGIVDAFSAFGASCTDDQGHGTHVAGTVGARDNSIGVIGVAPAAQLYCVKVLDRNGSGSDATLMAGLDWVLANHSVVSPAIRVINMSLGRPGTIDDNPAMRDLVAALDLAGVSVVASAGNDSSVEISQQLPAAYPQVTAVTSTTAITGSNQCRFLAAPIAADTASYFTTDGSGVGAAAPGEEQENVSRGCAIQSVGILSTLRGGGTTRMSGTSMASPHVAGVVARYYQQNPSYSPADIRAWLATDADRPGIAPLDSPTNGYTYDGVREGVVQAP
jgi:subtilisin